MVYGRRVAARETARRGGILLAGLSGMAGMVMGLTGCSSGPAAGATGTSCGTTRTGVGVPVEIKVVKGTVDCATVLTVERDYATMIREGRVQGNGGGAPVTVDGWICEAYPTPQVTRTGNASECHTASAEVVAVVSLSSPARM